MLVEWSNQVKKNLQLYIFMFTHNDDDFNYVL